MELSFFRGLKGKLFILVLLPILIFIGLSWLSIQALNNQRSNAEMIAHDRMPKLEAVRPPFKQLKMTSLEEAPVRPRS